MVNIEPLYGDLGDGLLLFYHINGELWMNDGSLWIISMENELWTTYE